MILGSTLLAFLVVPGFLTSNRGYPTVPPSYFLKALMSAQMDFRANDREGDGVHHFWRGDIAGLYALKSKKDPQGPPIKLIDLSLARADDRPVTDLSPYGVRSVTSSGYWYRSLLHEEERDPDPERFAACAFPDSPRAGRWTFIVDETKTIWQKELRDQRGLERFPRDPRKEGWTRIN